MYSIHLFLCHYKFIHNFQGHISQNCVYPFIWTLINDTDIFYVSRVSVHAELYVGSTPVRKKSTSLQNKTIKETAFITLTMYHISSYPGSLGLQNCIELDDSSL